MTDFKIEAEKICSAVDDYAKGKLIYKDDLLRLIELTLENNNLEILEDLAFQAKFSQGMVQIIRQKGETFDEEYFAKLKTELTDCFLKIEKDIEKIILHGSDFIKKIFKEKYFSKTQESITNLNNLCNDLACLKFYFNDKKKK